MTTEPLTKAQVLFVEIVADELLDDRREYSIEELAEAYEIDDFQARKLFELIQTAVVS